MKHLSNRVGDHDGSALQKLVMGLAALVTAALFSSCSTTGAGSNTNSATGQLTPSQLNHPQVRARNGIIATEAPGNYYIGRRWWTDGTRFWGYLREPGKPWSTAKLVIMNESIIKQPDRVP